MATATLPKGATNVGANLWSDVYNNDNALAAQVNGNLDATNLASNAVTTTKITDANVTTAKIATGAVTTNEILDGTIVNNDVANASIQDTKLTSPNNSVYRRVASFSAPHVAAGTTTGTYVYANGGFLPSPGPPEADGVFDFASGDYAVSSLTTRFRIRAQAFVGTTSPSTVTFNFGLYPVTISSGSLSLGTVVAGSQTTTSATPSLATNTISRYASSDFAASALLSDPGTYMLGVIIGSITVPATISLRALLDVRNT